MNIKTVFLPKLFITISYREPMKFVGDKYNVHLNVYDKKADEAILLLEPKSGEDYIYGPIENDDQV